MRQDTLPPLRPYFYRNDYMQGDSRLGTLTSKGGHRLLALPEELITGLHKAIEHETGRAWSIVAYTCGYKWGQRLLKTWMAEWRTFYQMELDRADYVYFQSWLGAAFEFYGWGQIELDFSLEQEGVIQYWLKDSVLVPLLAEFDDTHVCEIFAGLLAAMTSWLAGRELAGIEISCAKSGYERCRFAVAMPEYIEKARDQKLRGASADDILAALLEG